MEQPETMRAGQVRGDVQIISDKDLGLSIEIPGEWDSYKNPSPGRYKFSWQLMPPELKAWAVFIGIDRDASVRSVSQVTKADITVLQDYFKDYKVRWKSWTEREIGGLAAVQYAADYKDDQKEMVEYRAYLVSESMVYWFVFRIEMGMFVYNKDTFEGIVNSFKLGDGDKDLSSGGIAGSIKPESGKMLKIVVDEDRDGEPEVSVKLPLAGLKLANNVIPKEAREELSRQGIDIAKVLEEAEKLGPMTLLEVQEKNEHVLMTIEPDSNQADSNALRQFEGQRGVFRALKIVADENGDGRPEVSVKIPLIGLKLASAILPAQVKKDLAEQGIDLGGLLKDADSLEPMTLVDVRDKNEHVVISIE
jgi:hypothetical protein